MVVQKVEAGVEVPVLHVVGWVHSNVEHDYDWAGVAVVPLVRLRQRQHGWLLEQLCSEIYYWWN